MVPSSPCAAADRSSSAGLFPAPAPAPPGPAGMRDQHGRHHAVELLTAIGPASTTQTPDRSAARAHGRAGDESQVSGRWRAELHRGLRARWLRPPYPSDA